MIGKFITDVPPERIPPKPTDAILPPEEMTFPYVDFAFADPVSNWYLLAIIEYAEREWGNPKFSNPGLQTRSDFMEVTLQKGMCDYGFLDVNDDHIRHCIGDYLTYEREWNDGDYVHPWTFD